MNDWLRLLALPLVGGVIAIVAGLVFARRTTTGARTADNGADVNVHAWYLSGILAFLLVCALAVDWGSIPELATILSFAVGLASLILALIAIIQALTSTGSVQNSLAAVKVAADNVTQSTTGLAASVGLIEQAAEAVRTSATAATDAVADIAQVKAQLIASSEAGQTAIAALRADIHSKQALSTAPDPPDATPAASQFNAMSMGGGAAVYAVIRSFETRKSFVLADVLTSEKSLSFEEGYLSGLKNAGLIAFTESSDIITVSALNFDVENTKELILTIPYTKESTQRRSEQRIAEVEAYFADAGD